MVEYGHQDNWQRCELLIVCAASPGNHAEKILASVITFYESHWPDLPLIHEKIEIITK